MSRARDGREVRPTGRLTTMATLGYLALQAGKTVAALRAASRAPAAVEPSTEAIARVVVVQPILSGDPGLEDALRDNLLSLGGARFVWLVDEDDAEAQRVVERIGPAPRLEVRLCPPAPDGVNPKLAKLQPALDDCADDEVLLVLDDDTRLPRASLGALLGGLERATLATGLPAYLPGRTPWARLVEQFVDNNAALTYLPMAPVTICQTASPQWITTTVESPGHYVRLMHRWMLFANLLLRRQPPGTVAAISVLHGIHPNLLWAVLAGSVRTRRPGPLVALLGGRWVLLQVVHRRVYGRSLHAPLPSLVSELLQPAHLGHGAVQRTIRWRTRTYRVRSDDDFSPVR